MLSLYHGKDACHASRILSRLTSRPDLSRELTVVPLGQVSPPPSELAPLAARADAAAAEQQRFEEDQWLAHRQILIAALSDETIVAPSRLAHEPVSEQPDPPPEPDPNNLTRRICKGRGSSALGRAVHSVLQTIDLATLSDLDALAQAAARDEDVLDRMAVITEYVRAAAASGPVQQALACGHYWREVPVGVLRDDGSLLEGAIDLLYEHDDGTLGVVDYKTDRISEGQVSGRAEGYRAQGDAYRSAIETVTGKDVTTVEFVFAALAGRVVVMERRDQVV